MPIMFLFCSWTRKKQNGERQKRTTVMRRETTDGNPNRPSPGKVNPPTLTVDWDLYLKYLEDSDLSEEQKRNFIETLWSIVIACVDLGFGIHPLQQACEQNRDLAELIADNAGELLDSDASLATRDAHTAVPDRKPYTGKESA